MHVRFSRPRTPARVDRSLAPGRAALAVTALAAAILPAEAARADTAVPDTPLSTVVVEASALPGPAVSPTGASEYSASAADLAAAPAGKTAPLTDVLAQMPGVAIDQNQQIHIRNTEGPQFQYQINGVLVPLDINTNPSFVNMLNPMFVKRLDLLVGVLPARYSYATGGIVNIQTRDGCEEQPGTELALRVGQRETVEPSVEYSGCHAGLGSYLSAYYRQGQSAFSSATPGPSPVHDLTRQGQALGFFSYPLGGAETLSLLVSGAHSTNQLPNVPGLAPAYALTGLGQPPSSAGIDSYLDFSDALAMLTLSSAPSPDVSAQIALTYHGISQHFEPDAVGELVYQGVASTAGHVDHDYTLQGDVSLARGAHTLQGGFYAGEYRVSARDSSLVFPANSAGAQLSDVPRTIRDDASANNVLTGVYLSDLWRLGPKLSASAGLRLDALRGFTGDHQLDPSVSLVYRPDAQTTVHVGAARYFQVPSLLGISPTAQAAFAGTTAAGPPGTALPITEDDREVDAGVVRQLGALSVSADTYYEWTANYLDTGQFGIVPIFAPFNYGRGHMWGVELAARYEADGRGVYLSLTSGRNWQRGVVTGQFNFPADELAYIDSHAIVLDHQPLYGASAGASWRLGAYALSADGIYSSGLRAGFADQEQLPHVLQVNFSAERSYALPGVGQLTNRLAVMNLLDRVNLIRPAQGIGIFQSAYGPRLTFYDTLTLRF